MWSPSQPNGWNAHICIVGHRILILYGTGEVFVAELTLNLQLVAERKVSAPGRHSMPAGWLRAGEACWTSSLPNDRAQRYVCVIDDGFGRPDWSPGNHTLEFPSDPAVDAGNETVADGGHYASFLSSQLRVSLDGQILSRPAGGALALAWPWLCHAETNDNTALRVYASGQFDYRVATQAPLHTSRISPAGNVLYGGDGPLHGFDENGGHGSLLISPSRYEGPQQVFEVAGSTWLMTTDEFGTLLIRPWPWIIAGQTIDEKKAIQVPAGAVGARLVILNSRDFLIASWSEVGRLTVRTVAIDSVRSSVPVRVAPFSQELWAGEYYVGGRYGDHARPGNCTVLDLENFEDADKTLPPGAVERFRGFVSRGPVFIGTSERTILAVRDLWANVAGLVLGEFETAQQMDDEARAARARVKRAGLPQRPIVATLMPSQPFEGKVPQAVDWYGIECYLEPGAASGWEGVKRLTSRRFQQAIDFCPGKPVVLIAQEYDRNGKWKDLDALEAMQWATLSAARENKNRVVGVWGFAYARSGGGKDHPEIGRWHEALAAVARRPAIVTIGEPPPVEPPPTGGDVIKIQPGYFDREGMVGKSVRMEFAITADHRVIGVELDLLGDGEGAFQVIAPPGGDLRGLTCLGFKPAKAGDFNWQARAFDETGDSDESTPNRPIKVRKS